MINTLGGVFMKKFVKGLIIGTAVVVLGATAVFAAGTGSSTGSSTGNGTNSRAVQGSSSSAAAAENIGSACPWCQEDGHCYQDLDNDGVCDYYNTYAGANTVEHHRQENSHHGFQNGHHNSGQSCSSGYHGFCH